MPGRKRCNAFLCNPGSNVRVQSVHPPLGCVKAAIKSYQDWTLEHHIRALLSSYSKHSRRVRAASPPGQRQAQPLWCYGNAASIAWQGVEQCKPQIFAAVGPRCDTSHTASRTEHQIPCQTLAAESVAEEPAGHVHHLENAEACGNSN